MRIVRSLEDDGRAALGASILSGFGPRVEEGGLGLIGGYPYSAPYEDLRLKGK